MKRVNVIKIDVVRKPVKMTLQFDAILSKLNGTGRRFVMVGRKYYIIKLEDIEFFKAIGRANGR